MSEHSPIPPVLVVLDYDNLAVGLRNEFGARLDVRRLLAHVEETTGAVLVAAAYADWRHRLPEAEALRRAGCEPLQIDTWGAEGRPVKNAADMTITADLADALSRFPGILRHMVLGTGDGGVINTVTDICRRHRAGLTVVALSTGLNQHAARQADRVVCYNGEVASLTPLPQVLWADLTETERDHFLMDVHQMVVARECTTHQAIARRIARWLTSVPAERAAAVVAAAKQAGALERRPGRKLTEWQLTEFAAYQAQRLVKRPWWRRALKWWRWPLREAA